MAEQTGISWTDATFNPWVGCMKVSPGCAHCYAETLVTGRMGRAGTWGEDGTRERTSPSNWKKPLHWNKLALEGLLPNGKENPDGHRPRVFCASLADVFEPRAELRRWRYELLELIDATPDLDWLLLTKRPEVAHELYFTGQLALTSNIWLGTSIENSRFTWRADSLREIPAAVRFISAEPLVGSLFPKIESATVLPGSSQEQDGGLEERVPGPAVHRAPLDLTDVDWIIVGGESGGRNARPMHPTWVREIRDEVLALDTVPDTWPDGSRYLADGLGRPALHFKQWGSWTPDPLGRDIKGVWVSPDGRMRSEFVADITGDLPDGSMRMRYAGASPKSGGKFLDGVDWCEFPTLSLTPA
jgi:protein gp37